MGLLLVKLLLDTLKYHCVYLIDSQKTTGFFFKSF